MVINGEFMKITTLYENRNNPQNPSLEKGWGLSALIELNHKNILFDTGWNGNILIRNSKKLKIDLENVDELFISHPHWDHAGGLPILLEIIRPKKIYLPYDYSKNQLKEIQSIKSDSKVIICKNLTILNDSGDSKDLILSTGSKKGADIYEHSLVIKPHKQQKGIIFIGCCHPGLESLLNQVHTQYPVEIIYGGLHGFKDITLINKLQIKKMIIGHCTEHLSLFKEQTNLLVQELYVGLAFEI
jgi:7,8-dihydropterin-6-yl-methyl-4-(beta-D-ribofuranosyl)aminobenzene 5'-phosphate synthase